MSQEDKIIVACLNIVTPSPQPQLSLLVLVKYYGTLDPEATYGRCLPVICKRGTRRTKPRPTNHLTTLEPNMTNHHHPPSPFCSTSEVTTSSSDVAVGADGEWRIKIVTPDDAGCRFYLEKYKPFRLTALQRDPEGKQAN